MTEPDDDINKLIDERVKAETYVPICGQGGLLEMIAGLVLFTAFLLWVLWMVR